MVFAFQLDEMSIIEMVEKMSKPSKDEGEWIAKTDIEESGSMLKLVEHDDVGECNSDCKTIAKAVEAVIGDSDTDIAEELWRVGNFTRFWFSFSSAAVLLLKRIFMRY